MTRLWHQWLGFDSRQVKFFSLPGRPDDPWSILSHINDYWEGHIRPMWICWYIEVTSSIYDFRPLPRFWLDIRSSGMCTQRRVVIICRRFGTDYRVPYSRVKKSKNTSWPFKVGPIDFPEMSVNDYHSTLCNIPEERRFFSPFSFEVKSEWSYTFTHQYIFMVWYEEYPYLAFRPQLQRRARGCSEWSLNSTSNI
jgi:hypothetical protein